MLQNENINIVFIYYFLHFIKSINSSSIFSCLKIFSLGLFNLVNRVVNKDVWFYSD